jgi:hypothetical protein
MQALVSFVTFFAEGCGKMDTEGFLQKIGLSVDLALTSPMQDTAKGISVEADSAIKREDFCCPIQRRPRFA